MNFTKVICVLGSMFFVFKSKNLTKIIHQPEVQSPQKILILRSGAIGDVVMTTPLLKAFRKKYPQAEISYLVGNWSKKIIENNKYIDKIISFPDNIIYKKELKGTFNLIKQLRQEKFDLAFVLDKFYHWGILTFLSGIKYRFGFDRCGEGFANNVNVFYDGTKNEVDYYLELAEKTGANIEDKKTELSLTEKEEQFTLDFLQKNKLEINNSNIKQEINNSKIKLIGLIPGGAKNPGQELDLKRWPVEHSIELIKLILKSQEIKIILFGGPGDLDVSQKITSALVEEKINTKNLLDIIGKTSLTETAALMRKCALIISPDSGPLHIAAASGAKVIALFGPTPAKRFAPKDAFIFQKENPVQNCPCYDIYGNYKKCTTADCMLKITPEDVYKKIREMIKLNFAI
jgi:lipopolysaccharide heptosyltransferase II